MRRAWPSSSTDLIPHIPNPSPYNTQNIYPCPTQMEAARKEIDHDLPWWLVLLTNLVLARLGLPV